MVGVVIEAEAEDAELLPIEFVAYTVNVYDVDGDKPLTVILPEPDWETVPVKPPGLDVAVYDVIVWPPLLAGAVNETVAELKDVAVADTPVGAPGTDHVVIELLDDDDELLPTPLVAYTVNVYAVPVVKPFTVIVPEPACDIVPVWPPGLATAV